ncbi:maestro heat-like repeat-containing protein family member 7 isoform X1 [Passer domesticus]|uniref:maestro heat-like repeat-containing protein family member 7 isoform X1 n=1 Tax=Passer domesticus TaxID=48849 RepID=UPI0030FE78B6
MAMWKTIMGSSRTAELAQLVLLDVLGNWPEHSTCTSDGDKTGVFALAATLVMWKILQVRCVPHLMKFYFPRLFVHLLFQVFFSTEEMPKKVDTFWKGCQEEHGLATSPNSFAVRTLKLLLCRKQYKDVVVAMERKGAWDTLLCADTHHYAVGLLAREMSCVSILSCSWIFRYLLRLLSTQEPHWDLPALAFLVEVLGCLDLRERDADRVLQILSRHVQSKCRERRHLALRALLKLTDDPSMNNSQVQLLSILLFRTLLTLPLKKERKVLKSQVRQSLLPLFFHCHDENWRVAQASLETLLCVADFLKRKDLDKVAKEKKLWMFADTLECLCWGKVTEIMLSEGLECL